MSDDDRSDTGQEEPTGPQNKESGEEQEQQGSIDVAEKEPESGEEERRGENEPASHQPVSEEPDAPLINIQKVTEVKGHRRIGANKPRSTSHIVTSAMSSPSTATAASGKRTAVLSNEARREMAKQAKAAKDERRAMLDARHKYLITKLGHATSMAEAEVEEVLISDDKFSLIEEFFTPNGSKRLLFFYQEVKSRHSTHLSWSDAASAVMGQKKLFVTTGSAEGLVGMCLFFLRTTEKGITTANVSQEVNFGMLDCCSGNILQSLEKLVSQVMLPALKSQENWGAVKDGLKSVQIQDFLISVDKFVSSLSSAWQNIEGKFQLLPMEIEHNLDNLLGPSDYITAAGNSELVETLEGVTVRWVQQIEQVLTESEQMRKEVDDIGPSGELEHWKSRLATFNSLLDEIKSPQVKKVLGVLQVAKSKTLRRWKDLDGNITNAANEAKDNVKYLYTLEKFFSPLGKCTPTSILEHIPRLMNSIRMIYSISQYYNTSERMTSLFVKITNQMISTCKAYLCQGVTKIWDHDRQELLKRIKECIQLNEEYQLCFQHVREKLHENPNDKQFEFSENYIFGKFDTFCKRLEKIADITSTMESLSALQHLKIEGIEKIYVRYTTIVTSTKNKAYNVLDHRRLETERMLDLLLIFENVTGSQLDLMEKYMTVLQHYSRDLELVRKLYQKQRENPPTPRNMPPVPEMKKIIRSYNKMAAVLLEYELLYQRGWCRVVEVGRHALNASLLVRQPETKQLFVNLDPQVPELLHEARYMHRMGYQVPEVILNMCSNEAHLKGLHVQ
ncbi:hypothetical protein AGOR_G00179320 [Albula goreensis]|uniref:Dynein heavy chain tail domain-containing protein n=1 Tax=Albula goreensis TaxID=1534307 RepID=A0A8T3CVW1_9TELE|nr:hypothetical protein AGOR_G00179320 [Albula goreensis]